MSVKPPLADAEVLRVLKVLEPLVDDRSVVLVGGQAVAFWTRFLQARSSELAALAPLGSKDIDFEGDTNSVRRAAQLLGGRMRLPSMDDNTPNTGLVMFVDAEGVDRQIDFIDQPLGLKADEVRNAAVRLVLATDRGPAVNVWAMHPEHCMESRVYNAQSLGKTNSVAIRQLKASIICTREWSRYSLDREATPERVRSVLRMNERVFRRCLTDIAFKELTKKLGIDPFDAVLVDHDALPSRFKQTRYPQMLDQLETVRGHETQRAPDHELDIDIER
ncbi:MAG: hypothetical protein ACRDK4_11185 [Solirubrobacteraceae bacterium]